VIVSVGCICDLPADTAHQTTCPHTPYPTSTSETMSRGFLGDFWAVQRVGVRTFRKLGGLQFAGMRLTPTERDRLLLFSAAELARARQRRGLRLNVPEATALIADTAAEAARDGKRLLEAADLARSVLTAADVLPGVTDLVTEVKVEAVFDDGTRLIVIRDPFRLGASLGNTPSPGEVIWASSEPRRLEPATTLRVRNLADVPISITSHFHFFEVNPRLHFDRRSAYGMRLAIPAGTALRFDPGSETTAPLLPIGGDRIAIGFAGLVDGPLDDETVRAAAFRRAADQGYAGMDS
jgi:urease subunit gamma/beta